MDKEDGRSDLKEMKKTAEEREDDSKTSIPQKNGVEKQIPGKEDNANANANNKQQQQNSDNSQDGDSKKKEISNKDDSKEKNHNSSDKNDVKNQQKDSADQKEGQSSDETKPTNVSKNDEDGDSAKESDSADKAENGLENKTKKQNDSGKSSQSNSSVPNTALNNNKKQETVPLQQQSSLLLAKLASQQGLKKSSPLTTIGSSGNKPLSSFASSFKSNSSNFSRPPFLPKSYYSQNLNIIDEDTKLPTSSIQQIEAIRNETLLHSMSTKAQRILKAKAKAELLKKVDEKLGPLATFLNNLGLDIVKQSVYHEAIHIQSRKQQAGKLSDVECSQLDKMRSSCKELAEKLKHLKLSYRKCRLCNFVSESVNVHFWHREHPHINKREDFCCSYCDFNTRNNVAFNFHMEAEHNIKGRSMDKPSFWQCTLCPFEHNSKSKLTQHKFKCEKNFEIKTHLSPSPDTDINYSLYGVFYLSEKEEALKAIAIHKAKQAQLKAQQAQYKLQQQQAAANRANYFNANKISPIQPKPLLQSNMTQRIPVVVHPKIGSSLQPQMPGSQSNRFQSQSSIRQGQSNIPIKPFSPGLSQNSNRVQSLMNQSVNKGNLNLLQSQLPVKDLINIHQAIKGQNVMTAKSMASQKLIPSNTQPTSDVSEFEICELCGGYVKDRDALRIHFFYAHRVEMPALMFEKPSPPLFCDVCDKKFWTSQGLQKHRVSLKHYAKGSLSQVCILCGCLVSHLLNHMTETHQLNLQDFLNQKRCIVCGKVCLSRSETEIHMAASHGILVKRTNANSSDTKTKSDEKGGGSPVTMVTKSGQATSGTSASQLVKGNYCVFCKVPFASNAELTQHCLLVHKACKKCGMVLPGEGSLGSHKCQISIPTVKACSVCKQEILIQEFIKHVEEKHLKKCSIKLKRLNSEDIDAGINDTKTELDSPVGTKPNASGVKEEPRKRKAEDVDLESKKRKLAAEDGAKGEAISISDSEEDEQEEEQERAEEEEQERAEEEEEQAEEEEEPVEEEEQAEEDGGDDDDDVDEDDDEDMDDDDDDDDDKEMRTDSLDESLEKGRKDVKGTDSSIGNKKGGADNDKHLSSKPDSEWGSRWDNKNKKDNSE